MSRLVNCIIVLIKGLFIVLNALLTLLQLLLVGLGSLFGKGNLSSRLAAAFSEPVNQRRIFTVLRTFAPNIVLSRKFITAYDNSGTAIVTRDEDVREILNQDGIFHVVYEAKIRKVTNGANFFLGMQDTPDYTRDVSDMRLAVRREDVPEIIVPLAAAEADGLVAQSGGRIDLPQDLLPRVPARMVARYFGTPGPSEDTMIEWTTAMFWYLFVDLAGSQEVEQRALAAARPFCDYLDKTIADRKSNPQNIDDVVGRCLDMQRGEVPGMDDLGIRNNLVGLVIGAIPTIAAASAQALNQLLERPQELNEAQEAARADDDARLASYIFEALRFHPLNPIIYRRATADYMVAKGTLRAKRIPKDTMVIAANLSAMFDPWKVKSPGRFRVDRPWDTYILWGYGLHTCFGQHINHAVIPQILKPLLKKDRLRRAPGAAGQIDTAGTPFPVHMEVEFDPA